VWKAKWGRAADLALPFPSRRHGRFNRRRGKIKIEIIDVRTLRGRRKSNGRHPPRLLVSPQESGPKTPGLKKPSRPHVSRRYRPPLTADRKSEVPILCLYCAYTAGLGLRTLVPVTSRPSVIRPPLVRLQERTCWQALYQASPPPSSAQEKRARGRSICGSAGLEQPKPGFLRLKERLTDSVVRLQTNDQLLNETFWNHYHKDRDARRKGVGST